MKKPIPTFDTDKEAEDFVDTADLSQYDLSGGQVVRFELKRKDRPVTLRLPSELLDAVRARAERAGVPYQRFIRLALERALQEQEVGRFVPLARWEAHRASAATGLATASISARIQRCAGSSWSRRLQIMNIGSGGQGTGGGALARSRKRPKRMRPGAVASRSLPRRKAGTPANPGR